MRSHMGIFDLEAPDVTRVKKWTSRTLQASTHNSRDLSRASLDSSGQQPTIASHTHLPSEERAHPRPASHADVQPARHFDPMQGAAEDRFGARAIKVLHATYAAARERDARLVRPMRIAGYVFTAVAFGMFAFSIITGFLAELRQVAAGVGYLAALVHLVASVPEDTTSIRRTAMWLGVFAVLIAALLSWLQASNSAALPLHPPVPAEDLSTCQPSQVIDPLNIAIWSMAFVLSIACWFITAPDLQVRAVWLLYASLLSALSVSDVAYFALSASGWAAGFAQIPGCYGLRPFSRQPPAFLFTLFQKVVLSVVCAHPRAREVMQRAMARQGKSAERAAVIASLLGGRTVDEARELAAADLCCVPTDRITEDHLRSNVPDASLHALSEPAALSKDIDAFISHSWSDPPGPKWAALQHWREAFISVHGREPRVWLDKYCIPAQSVSAQLASLPINLAASDRLLVLAGPSYLKRSWCILEVWLFKQLGGHPGDVDVLVIDEAAGAPGTSPGAPGSRCRPPWANRQLSGDTSCGTRSDESMSVSGADDFGRPPAPTVEAAPPGSKSEPIRRRSLPGAARQRKATHCTLSSETAQPLASEQPPVTQSQSYERSSKVTPLPTASAFASGQSSGSSALARPLHILHGKRGAAGYCRPAVLPGLASFDVREAECHPRHVRQRLLALMIWGSGSAGKCSRDVIAILKARARRPMQVNGARPERSSPSGFLRGLRATRECGASPGGSPGFKRSRAPNGVRSLCRGTDDGSASVPQIWDCGDEEDDAQSVVSATSEPQRLALQGACGHGANAAAVASCAAAQA
eukprot:CAMPEP_0206040262 /NCGR_PEP_ID=MMETSP1466-20131121/5278_1 /ASSEMBLY_ACC=CAM_ASM_001126 /TAXON_ID=44452 /ORGANISM="Pavlova gyrans, Strain CCMP608" /LENGTH=810 /DNA_ID=CAMNT_0053414935 /DNA_START=60 /DNA_END=2488 /DNA_ORIENTATION=-